MKRFFIDTEFNGFCGRLISMAIVSEDLKNEFYEVLQPNTYIVTNLGDSKGIDPWVEKNVLPILNKEPISVSEFQAKLSKFLCDNSEMGEITIIADWPEDITHLTKMMITSPGRMIHSPNRINAIVDRTIQYKSLIEHNALEDARAIAKSYIIK
jgi:hypothetical protein